MPLLTPESIALLKRMDADEALQAAAMAGWNMAVEAAADLLERMNESAGDAASYDNRDMYCCERERMDTAQRCANRIRALAKQEEV